MEVETSSRLSDAELIAEVARLAQVGRGLSVRLVVHLAEFESRGLHLRAGYSSLYSYCIEVLHLSEAEAYNRIEAGRAGRRFPRLLEMLANGQLTLTTVRLLARRLTPENCNSLLAAASGMSKRQVEDLLAARWPRPDPPASIVPLGDDRVRFAFTGTAETRELLELARDMLRHALPDGDTGQIVTRALRLLVTDLTRRRFAATPRPRGGQATPDDGRYISAEVKRAVWIRDRGRCAFIGRDHRRCNERAWLEFHHVIPYARGGRATVENIQLRCRAHNGYEAALEFGWRTRPGTSPLAWTPPPSDGPERHPDPG